MSDAVQVEGTAPVHVREASEDREAVGGAHPEREKAPITSEETEAVMDPNAAVVEEREFDTGLLTNKSGDIIINAAQQDLVLIRRRFSDDTLDFWVRPHNPKWGGGRRVIPRFDPATQQPVCRHCGEEL